jgi:hypothetical protein
MIIRQGLDFLGPYLDYWNRYLDIIGLIITCITLFISWNVKKSVDNKLDRVKFHEDLEKNIGIIGGIFALLDSNDSIDVFSLKKQIADFCIEVSTNYSFLSKITVKKLNELTEFDLNDLELSQDRQIELRKIISALKILLQKEARK